MSAYHGLRYANLFPTTGTIPSCAKVVAAVRVLSYTTWSTHINVIFQYGIEEVNVDPLLLFEQELPKGVKWQGLDQWVLWNDKIWTTPEGLHIKHCWEANDGDWGSWTTI